MTDQVIPPELSNAKPPMQSRKFLAFLVSEISWKIIIGIILVMGMKNGSVDLPVGSIILVCVLIAGFVEAGYIIGQGSLDKYLGLAQIAAQNGHTIKLKGAEISAPAQAAPESSEKPQTPDADG